MLVQGMTVSFLAELPLGVHVVGTDVFKMALYSASASLDWTTTAYTATGEITGTGYVAGGATLLNGIIGSSVVNGSAGVWITFDNPSWTGPITARGALIYNSSKGNKSMAVLDFGADRTSTPFVVQMPLSSATTGLLRLPIGG